MTDSAKDGGFSLNTNLNLYISLVVSLSSIVQVWTATQLNQSLEETRRLQEFSKQIFGQVDNLTSSNSQRSKLALVGLYVIAKADQDKLAIAQIALQSGKKDLRNTAASLLAVDCSKLDDRSRMAFCSQANQILVSQAENHDRADHAATSISSSGGRTDLPPVRSAMSQALERTTAVMMGGSAMRGWAYLGRVNAAGTFQADATTSARRRPAPNAVVTTRTSVVLRDKGTSLEGTTLGIIRPGQRLRVDGTAERQLADGSKAIWAQVVSLPR